MAFCSESQIQKGIIQFLELKKVCFFRTNTKGEFLRKSDGTGFLVKNKNKGWPDIFCIIDAKTVFLEVKSAKGRLSVYQKDFARKVIDAGAFYFVVRSIGDVSSVLDYFEKVKGV